MSRASEITLLLILMQASIGFVDATGLFTAHYLEVPSNNASYTLTDLNAYATAETQTNPIDEIMLFAHWAWEAFFIGIKILLTVIFVLPTLISVFNVPTALALFIQAGIYYIYATWYAQYKSGKPWGMIREV